MKCESIDVIDREFNWDLDKTDKVSNWNGRMVQPLTADLSMQNVYHSAAVTAANMSTNGSAHIYLIEDTHGNDSYNPPSSSWDGYRNSDNSEFDLNGGWIQRKEDEAKRAGEEANRGVKGADNFNNDKRDLDEKGRLDW